MHMPWIEWRAEDGPHTASPIPTTRRPRRRPGPSDSLRSACGRSRFLERAPAQYAAIAVFHNRTTPARHPGASRDPLKRQVRRGDRVRGAFAKCRKLFPFHRRRTSGDAQGDPGFRRDDGDLVLQGIAGSESVSSAAHSNAGHDRHEGTGPRPAPGRRSSLSRVRCLKGRASMHETAPADGPPSPQSASLPAGGGRSDLMSTT